MDTVDEIVEQWRSVRPDVAEGALGAMATIGRLGRIHALASRRVDAVFDAHGIQTGEFDVLAALRRNGGAAAPGELSRTLLLSPAGMTNRLDRLEAAGHILREADPDDRRSLRVVLTDGGRRVVDAALADHLENEQAILEPLTQRDRAALDKALRTLLAHLSA